jgi:GntR family transcriptional regulator
MRKNSQAATLAENALPLYYRIKAVLEERIRSGSLAPRSQLPSESDLCREFGVSRGTVREALRDLVAAGLVERRHGKGSFVSPHPNFAPAPIKYTGLLEDLYEQVRKVTVHAVEIEVASAPAGVLKALELRPGTPLTIVHRERYLDGTPFAYTVNFLPMEIGERIDPVLLRKYPLLRILEEHLHIVIDRAEQSMHATLADAVAARRLVVPFASPVMFAERLYFEKGGKPLQIAQTFYRADRYQFTVGLSRYRKKGQWRWDYQKDTNSEERRWRSSR